MEVSSELLVCHLPVQLRFGNIVKSLCLPVFVCNILSSKVNCIFGIDAGRAFKFVHCYDTGTMWFQDYPDHTPLVCIPKVIPQEDSYYARVLKRVVIKPQSFAPVEVGTHNSMPPHGWHSTVLYTCTDSLLEEHGATMLQGLVDFTKGPATICVINLAEHDLILKSGPVVVGLSPIELFSKCTTNTGPFLDPKMVDTYEGPHLHTLFPMSKDGYKRNDNFLPQSLFNIIPSKYSTDFPLAEREKLVKMFNLRDKSNMSDFEDDVDIISCPLASPRSEPLGEYELPEAIEKLLLTCKSNVTEEQMKIVREKLADMTDMLMDPSVPLVRTNAVAH